MVTFKFKLTAKEYLQYNYYTAWADPGKKSYRFNYFLRVFLLYGFVAALYILTSKSHLIWIDILVFVLTGTVYLMLVPFFIRQSVKRRVSAILTKKENLHILEESEIILSDTTIVDRDTVSESRYSWDAIVRICETADSFYLYTNSYHAIVIPKRVMNTGPENKEVLRLFHKCLPLSAEFPEKLKA